MQYTTDELKKFIGKYIHDEELPLTIDGWYPVINNDEEIINFVTTEWDALLITTKEYAPADVIHDDSKHDTGKLF